MTIIPEVKAHYGMLPQLIGGEWVEPSSSAVMNDSLNPATGEVIAQYPSATHEEALRVVEAAAEGFKVWKEVPLRTKGRMLFELRQKFDENADMLARVLTQELGSTFKESDGSIRRSIENIESACSAVYGMPARNEHIDNLATGIDQWLSWEPVGAFLILTPSNIPTHAWSSFVPYALAAGCSIILKPSQYEPLSSYYITKLTQECGFPAGAVNLVYGDHAMTELVLRQPAIRGVGFIGSSGVGRELFRVCGELGKNSSINGSGKNTIVVLPDANLDEVPGYVRQGCFGMTGQRCLGTDNVVVVGDIYDEFKERFVAEAKSMKLGYGLDTSVSLGPYASERGRDKVLDWIGRALDEGCTMVLDGREVPEELKKGFFIGPTILEGGNVDMETAKEEAFGAVSCLIRADSLEQAIEWINTKHNWGHSASIMTQSGKSARRFIHEVIAGNVAVNAGIPQPYAFFPLSSKRDSFFGGAKSRMSSMRLFLEEKTVTARWI